MTFKRVYGTRQMRAVVSWWTDVGGNGTSDRQRHDDDGGGDAGATRARAFHTCPHVRACFMCASVSCVSVYVYVFVRVCVFVCLFMCVCVCL